MTAPTNPRRKSGSSGAIRYVRDRETDARWVSAEAITRPAIVRAEMARLRAAGRTTVTTLAGRIYVDWSNETTPNPGRTPRPGGTQPESERKRKVLPIRLSEAARAALDALVAQSGESRSAVVERLVLGAAARTG